MLRPSSEIGTTAPGWRRERVEGSLSEVFGTIAVRPAGPLWRRLLAFLGPGYLVAVGYMDPGNWATSLAAGSKFGYALLSIALLSNIMAIVLQALCARLGIGAGRDLAQACRDAFPRVVSIPLWAAAEIAICATDLAEVIGTAIGLNLLFNIPLELGVLLTALDVLRRALDAAAGLSLGRGLYRNAAGRDRCVLRSPDRHGRSALGGGNSRVCTNRRHHHQSRQAVSRTGHPRGHRNAA